MGRTLIPLLSLAGCGPVRMSPDLGGQTDATHRPWAGLVAAPPDVTVRVGGTIDSVTAVGDVTGDGEGDWVVTTTIGGSTEVHVVAGPLTGDRELVADALVTLADPSFDDLAVVPVAGGFAVGSASSAAGDGRVLVFSAPVDASTTVDSAVVLTGAGGERAGAALASADLTGDGVDDLLVGAPGYGFRRYGASEWDPGRVYLVPGPLSYGTLAGAAVATFTGSTGTTLGTSELGAAVAVVADDNGDGLSEIALGSTGRMLAGPSIYGMVGVARSPFVGAADEFDLAHLSERAYRFGSRLASADLDGDGDRDLLVSGYDNFLEHQQACAYAELLEPIECHTILDQAAPDTVPGDLGATPVGDVDGDGYEDLMLVPEQLPGEGVTLAYGPLPPGRLAFAARTDLGASFPGERAVPAGDVDGDGQADVSVIEVDAGGETWSTWLGEPAPPRGIGDLEAGDLVITELLPDPAGCADSAAEWVEVYVAGDRPVDLAGLELRDLAGTTGTIGGPLVVPGGAFVVLGIGSAGSWCDGAVAPSAFYGPRPQLNNTGSESLELRADGRVIDRTATLSGATAARSWSSTSADPDANDTLDGWATASPTPGRANGS